MCQYHQRHPNGSILVPFRRLVILLCIAGAVPFSAAAQTAPSRLHLELNNLQDNDGTCRLSFLAKNETGTPIDKAVFETVIFDSDGGVANLSLFDFRDLPAGSTRVRQFDLPGRSCNSVGKALINGANSCVAEGAESTICKDALSLSSRLEIELIG
jgi:hypothetical protein